MAVPVDEFEGHSRALGISSFVSQPHSGSCCACSCKRVCCLSAVMGTTVHTGSVHRDSMVILLIWEAIRLVCPQWETLSRTAEHPPTLFGATVP